MLKVNSLSKYAFIPVCAIVLVLFAWIRLGSNSHQAKMVKHSSFLIGHDIEVSCVIFSPNGRWIASAGINDTTKSVDRVRSQKHDLSTRSRYSINLWDTKDWKLKHSFSLESDAGDIAFSSDSKFLIAGAVSTATLKSIKLSLWDVSTGKKLYICGELGKPQKSEISAVGFSSDGQLLVTGSSDSKSRVWRLRDGKLLHTFTQSERVTGVNFSPDNKLLATISWDNDIRIWDIDAAKEMRQIFVQSSGYAAVFPQVRFSLDGKYIATATSDNWARLWNVTTGKLEAIYKGHTDRITSIAFGTKGKVLVTGSWDGTARLWDVSTITNIEKFVGHTAPIYSVAISPNGKIIATGGEDGSFSGKTLRIWDTAPNSVPKG